MVNSKSKLTSFLLFLILFVFVLNTISAHSQGANVYDDANIFSNADILSLDEEASELGNKYNMDIIIVTTDDANGQTSRVYADDYFDYNGFGKGANRDGILFLIDMDNREIYISTSGEGIKYLTDKRIENILQDSYDRGVSDGDFYSGTRAFLNSTESYLQSGIPSNQYSEDEKVKDKNKVSALDGIIGLIGGAISSSGFYFRTKSKYKMKNPVKPLTFRDNSTINLVSHDNRLLDTITTHRLIPRPTSNSSSDGRSTTHTSSSGRTHGGGGKKF